MTGPYAALIGADELFARIDEPRLRVADVRWYVNQPGAGRAAYDSGHIPGAVFVDIDTDLADPAGFGSPGRHPLPSTQKFARRMGSLGLGSEDHVVVYDDAGGTIAARMWWMLDSLGHRGGVAVLNGGLQAWTAAGYPLTSETTSLPTARLELDHAWPRVIGRDALMAQLGRLQLLDVRAAERYRGEIEPIDPQAGHIPSALNAPTANNLDPAGLMRDVSELRPMYEAVATRDTTVVSCGSGVTACHAALAMRIAGLPDPVLYVGSFSDWSRSGLPVVAGSLPGTIQEAPR